MTTVLMREFASRIQPIRPTEKSIPQIYSPLTTAAMLFSHLLFLMPKTLYSYC